MIYYVKVLLKIGYPIPQENISKYKEVTGEEINQGIFCDDDNKEDPLEFYRPMSTALFGEFGDEPLTFVGHIFDDNGNIIKEQYA